MYVPPPNLDRHKSSSLIVTFQGIHSALFSLPKGILPPSPLQLSSFINRTWVMGRRKEFHNLLAWCGFSRTWCWNNTKILQRLQKFCPWKTFTNRKNSIFLYHLTNEQTTDWKRWKRMTTGLRSAYRLSLRMTRAGGIAMESPCINEFYEEERWISESME